MGEGAGRVAVLLGPSFLRPDWGGKGILLSKVDSEICGTVGVIGCGHVGRAAIEVACGLGANVIAADTTVKILQDLRRRYGKKIKAVSAQPSQLERLVAQSDLLIGAVLVAGRRAPQVVTAEMVRRMEAGSVIVDVAIDQGGCVATSRLTTIAKPVFKKFGVLHCAIANLPALVPRTASQLLAKCVEPYLLKLANQGWEGATAHDPVLARGLNVVHGEIVYPGLIS